MDLHATGWFICYGSGVPIRRTWHYFDGGRLRSRCGVAAMYMTSFGAEHPVEHVEQMSSVALMKAGFCRRCDRTRRPEEGR